VVVTIALCLAGAGAWGAEQAVSSSSPDAEKEQAGVVGEVKLRPELQTMEGVKSWVINGKEITMSQIEKVAAAHHGPFILQDLVAELLLQQEAARKGITLSDQDIQKSIVDLREQLGVRSDVALDSFLRSQSATPQWFQDKARAYALMRKVLADRVYVSDREVESYYNRNQQMYRRGQTILFRAMTFDNKGAADSALAEVRKGKSFQEVAKATTTAPGAGEIQTYEQGQPNVPQEFATVLAATPLSQVAGPVEIGGRFYLIKIEKKIDPHQFSLDETVTQDTGKVAIRDLIRQQLSQQKLEQKAWPEWVQSQLKAADIQVRKAQ
jgi:parvulin-like peptidyl-prolyl isomerase